MKNIFSWGNSSLIKNHILLKNPLSLPQNQILIFIWSQKNRKAEISYIIQCEDSRGVENACSAFLLAPTSHCIIYEISAFLLFGSRRKLVFRFEEEEGIIQKIMRINQRKILHKAVVGKYNFYTIE